MGRPRGRASGGSPAPETSRSPRRVSASARRWPARWRPRAWPRSTRARPRELQEAHAGETIVLVSHAIVIRLIVLDALGLGHERLWTVDATPAGITEIEYEPGWATVHRMNTLAHLEAVER